jgi:hypothetical protein
MPAENDIMTYLSYFMEYTGTTKDQLYHQCHGVHGSDLSAVNLLQIAKNIDVDPIRLWSQDLDLDVIKAKKKGVLQLPAKYSEVQNSPMASIVNLLEQFKRLGLYDYVLKKHQLNEVLILANQRVSILAIGDLLNFGGSFFTQQDYLDFADRNSTYSTDNIFLKHIPRNNSHINIVKKVMELASSFEQNWKYFIVNSTHNSITIETFESEQMQDAKAYTPYTNPVTLFCRYAFLKKTFFSFGIENVSIETVTSFQGRNNRYLFKITV